MIFNRKTVIRAAAAVAFSLPFFFAVSGTDWAHSMHPDEINILIGMRETAETGCVEVKSSVYPEGFFVLADLYRRISIPFRWLGGLADQERVEHRDVDYIRSPIKKGNWPTLATGRRTNVILAGLCGLFLFLAIRSATGSAVGGLCASAIAACSPFLLEHAHYCETDVVFCTGMALALWLLFTAIRRDSLSWVVGGAAASSAAFACKYTVAPIVPFCVLVFLALCVRRVRSARTPDERRNEVRGCAIALACCLFVALAAYVVFTPLVRKDFALFCKSIFNIYGDAHREAAGRDLAGDGSIRKLLFWSVCHSVAGHLKMTGPLHLALAAMSAIFLAIRARRNPCGVWLIVLLLLFVAFDLTVAPWIRSQEFLPFAVIFGTMIAFAVGELCAIAGSSRLRLVRVAVPAACLAAGFLLAFGDAMRVARMFTTEDCRNTMRHWLEMTSNPDTRFAAGRLAAPALRLGRINTANTFDEAEEFWDVEGGSSTNAPQHEYFVRQTVFLGRGFRDAITNRRTPRWHAGWTNFLAHAVLLREWKLVPGYQTTFSQLPMELWGIVPEDCRMARPKPLSARPTAYRMGPEHYDAAQGGDFLGPIDAIRTVGARKGVRFVPPADGRPLYAVTRHAEGLVPAKIKWEGCFEPREKVIPPGRADWSLYKPGLLDGWGDIYVRTRVRMRGDDQTSFCLTTITADPAYAAELLAMGGSPDKAAELLASAGLPADLDTAFAKSVPELPESFYNDFARIRLDVVTVYPAPVPIPKGARFVQLPGPTELESEFPVFFEPGTYHVSFRIPSEESGSPELKSFYFSKAASQRFISGGDLRPGENVEMEITFDRPASPRVCGVSISKGDDFPAVPLCDFTITWKAGLDAK